MFERFTEGAGRVVAIGHEEARRRRHRTLDADHLAFAAVTVLQEAIPNSYAVREGLDSALARQSSADEVEEHLQFSPEAKDALSRSLRLSVRAGRSTIDERDLLLAFLEQANVTEPLTEAGIDLDALRAELADAP